MDLNRFDDLARVLSVSGSRRRVLGLVTTLPVVGGLASLLAPEDAQAKGQRKPRGAKRDSARRRRKQKRKRTCTPNSAAQTCAGKCGTVLDNCKGLVECGSCVCAPPCPVCHRCTGNPATCRPDPDFRGLACGTGSQPGLVCQTDGRCVCDATSCPPPLTCGGGGNPEQCGCTPTTCEAAGAECGTIDDGCGGRLDCGSCGNGQACVDNACQACASTAECGSGRICVDGTCQVCDVECVGSAYLCGVTLRTAMENPASNTVYVCPGTYQGGFELDRALTLVGAGGGGDPATSTILDAANLQSSTVIAIPEGTIGTVALRQLRLTRGASGVEHRGARLEMRDCVVVGNRQSGMIHYSGSVLEMTRCTVRGNGPDANGYAGGLQLYGQATLTDCLIEGNQGFAQGGGITVLGQSSTVTLAGETIVRDNTVTLNEPGFGGGGIYVSEGSVTIGRDCRVTGNTAAAGIGGGILNTDGTVTLEGPAPSPIVVDNCHENCVGDVPKCASGGTCPA